MTNTQIRCLQDMGHVFSLFIFLLEANKWTQNTHRILIYLFILIMLTNFCLFPTSLRSEVWPMTSARRLPPHNCCWLAKYLPFFSINRRDGHEVLNIPFHSTVFLIPMFLLKPQQVVSTRLNALQRWSTLDNLECPKHLPFKDYRSHCALSPRKLRCCRNPFVTLTRSVSCRNSVSGFFRRFASTTWFSFSLTCAESCKVLQRRVRAFLHQVQPFPSIRAVL